MEIQVRIYLMKDAHGNITSVTFEDLSDTVQPCGLRNPIGEKVYFESEAYHLVSWCAENDIEIRHYQETKDFDSMWEALAPKVDDPLNF